MPVLPPTVNGHTFIPLKDLGYQLGLTFHDFPKLLEELDKAGVPTFRIAGQIQVSETGYQIYVEKLQKDQSNG